MARVETRTFKIGARFHVTVGSGKYDAILFLHQTRKAALFNLPIKNILWDKPISDFNLPSLQNIGKGEKGVSEEDLKSYVASTRFGGLHPEKAPAVILEAY